MKLISNVGPKHINHANHSCKNTVRELFFFFAQSKQLWRAHYDKNLPVWQRILLSLCLYLYSNSYVSQNLYRRYLVHFFCIVLYSSFVHFLVCCVFVYQTTSYSFTGFSRICLSIFLSEKYHYGSMYVCVYTESYFSLKVLHKWLDCTKKVF